MSLNKPSTWPASAAFVFIPLGISLTYLVLAYFGMTVDDYYREDLEMIRKCAKTLDCSQPSLGPYILLAGMVFAIGWVVAYISRYKFPMAFPLLFLGVVLASPLYSAGFFLWSRDFTSDGNNELGMTVMESVFIGTAGSALHILGLAIAIRMAVAVMKRGKKNP